MKHAVIDHTDIAVSRLGFGTASLHHLFGSGQRQKLLRAAASAGITHFDTSPYYGYGLAESDLGLFLCGQRTRFTVTTKVGLYPWGPASGHALGVWTRKAVGRLVPRVSLPVANWQVSHARESLHRSLRRLRTDYVDFLLLHEPDPVLVAPDEFLRWFESEASRGKLRAWGVAGTGERVTPFVMSTDLLARVVQVKDSLERKEADFMIDCGRRFQFTYGYISSRRATGVQKEAGALMAHALARNQTGAILVSSRRAEHIGELARMAA